LNEIDIFSKRANPSRGGDAKLRIRLERIAGLPKEEAVARFFVLPQMGTDKNMHTSAQIQIGIKKL
jgi:hypothetical protein